MLKKLNLTGSEVFFKFDYFVKHFLQCGRSGGVSAKIYIHSFETLDEDCNYLVPKIRVWFSIVCSFNSKLYEYYKSLPPNYCRYKESLRLWIFDFEIYDQIISTLTSISFGVVVSLEELPLFLVKGLLINSHF